MNTENVVKAIDSLSGVAKTYMRISYMKTALTAVFIGYAAVKTVMFFRSK